MSAEPDNTETICLLLWSLFRKYDWNAYIDSSTFKDSRTFKDWLKCSLLFSRILEKILYFTSSSAALLLLKLKQFFLAFITVVGCRFCCCPCNCPTDRGIVKLAIFVYTLRSSVAAATHQLSAAIGCQFALPTRCHRSWHWPWWHQHTVKKLLPLLLWPFLTTPMN